MKMHHEKYEHPLLSEMLREVPLEQPPNDFMEKVMNQIHCIGAESKVYFYQRPIFITLASIGFAACFLLFYNANFSFLVLSKQMGHYYTMLKNHLASLHFSPPQITFSPIIVAPVLLFFCIFVADRMMAAYKKRRQHQIFCI